MTDWETWKKRPARRQVDESTLAGVHKGERENINLWSGRSLIKQNPWEPREREKKVRSKYRCIPHLDCGRTRGSDAGQHQFCLYFAKGCCSQGQLCTFLHRIPTAEDEEYHVKDLGADIFGREKRGEAEGYRSGAGTIERDNRVLYINYEGAGCYEVPKIRELLQSDFGTWGEIKSIYIVHPKNIAFIRFAWRSAAEFAKEAMHKQGLLGSTQGEVLAVRWSSEDPNPVAIAKTKREYRDAFEEAAYASWEALPEEQKRARIMQLQLMAAMKERRAISEYPNTDDQYGAGPSGTVQQLQAGEPEAYPNTDSQYASYPNTDAQYQAYPNTDAQYQAYPNTDAQYGGAGVHGMQGQGGDGGEAGAVEGATATTGYGTHSGYGTQPQQQYQADGSGQHYQAYDQQYQEQCYQYDPAYYQQYYQQGEGQSHQGGEGEGQGASVQQQQQQEEQQHEGEKEEEGGGGLAGLLGYGSSSDDEGGD